MEYYVLTDRLHSGQIIQADGRKHYRFVFGSYQWERTTLFQAYLTEGTPLFGQYRQISQEQAMEQLTQYGRGLGQQLRKAQAFAEKALAGKAGKDGSPYVEYVSAVADSLPDWDEKIAATLSYVCQEDPQQLPRLEAAGFAPHICNAVSLLAGHTGTTYEGYLKTIRQNRIARNVKLMDLSARMNQIDPDRATPEALQNLQACKQARQFLYGDIPTFTGQVDEQANAPGKLWRSCMEIYQSIRPLALEGRKVPYGLSNPVLCKRGDRLCLAFFVYTYSREDLQKGQLKRPDLWLTADVENGQLLERIPCTQEDFSKASRDERYSTHNPYGQKDGAFFCETYALLDAARQAYLKTGQPDGYTDYLDRILQAVPPAYHRFYRELSLTGSPEK